MIDDSKEKTPEKTSEEPEEAETKKKKSDGVTQILTPEELQALMRAQIDRNNEWIEKMSPVIKYKIQEYVRKQRAKKMQRRKFSLACGLMNRVKQEPSTPSATRRRNRRVNSAAAGTSAKTQKTVPEKSKKTEEKEKKKKKEEEKEEVTVVEEPAKEKKEAETGVVVKVTAVIHRRKSAPVRMDMRDLDDLE